MPLSILLLCDDNPQHPAMLLDHIEAINTRSRHDVYLLNNLTHPAALDLDLNEFDVVVNPYSVAVSDAAYFPRALRARLRDFAGLKVQFLQDDYAGVDA